MLVQKLNVVLDVTPEEVESYYARGFDILNEDGTKVVRKAVPVDVPSLQMEYRKHVKEIKELKEEIASLKKEIEELKAKPQTKTTTRRKSNVELDI